MTEDIRWVRTHCARMDHGGCGIVVGVKDNRIVKVKGDPDGFLNRGYLCVKGVASPEKLSHPDRHLGREKVRIMVLRHHLAKLGKNMRGAGTCQGRGIIQACVCRKAAISVSPLSKKASCPTSSLTP